MNGEDSARSGEGVINKPVEFDIEETGNTRYYHVTRKTDGREFTCVVFYDANSDSSDIFVDACDEEIVTEEERDVIESGINNLLNKQIDDNNTCQMNGKIVGVEMVKIVNTGVNKYIEFENKIAGFKDGEALEYRACQDGTAVIVRKI